MEDENVLLCFDKSFAFVSFVFFVVVVFCSFFFCAVKNILNVFRQVLVLISLAENAVHVSEKV